MYLSASNALSVNGTPIMENFYESNAPTQKELEAVKTNLVMQDKLMESLMESATSNKKIDTQLVANTTGLGATLDILA